MSVSNKLDYKIREYSHPKYKLHRLIQQNGGTTQTITPAGGDESIFELPANVFNLAKSHIRGTIEIDAPVAGGIVSNVYNSQLCLINEIHLYNSSGTMVCDWKFVNNCTDIVSKSETKLYDFLTNPSVSTQTTFLNRNDSSTDRIMGKRYDNSEPSLNITEHQYFLSGTATVANPPVGGAINLPFTIPFSAFKNTVLSYDKDIYFGEIMYLRIKWAASPKIGWTSGVVYTAAAGGNPAFNTYNPAAAPVAAFNVNVHLSNLQAYLSQEDDLSIQNAFKSQCSLGMVHRIPFIWANKTTLNGTTQNVTMRLNSGHGKRLHRIYHAFYNTTESANTAYDHSNINSEKCVQYYTMLNNSRRQEFDIRPVDFDDYMINWDRFKGTVIQNPDIFLYNYFVLDDFTESECIDSTNNKLIMGMDCGISLNTDLKWDIYCQIPAGYNPLNNQLLNHYTFAIVSRDLYIGPGGMRFQ